MILLLLAALSSALTADELWEQALGVAASNGDWLAQEIEIEMQQLTRRGDVAAQGSSRVSCSVSSSGEIRQTVSQSGDAPPDPDEVLAGGLGLPRALREGAGSLLVFAPDRQGDLELSRQRRTESLPGGVEAAVYTYAQPEESGRIVQGRVWLDIASGVPVRVETTPAEPPSPLVSTTTTIEFNNSPVEWYPVLVEVEGVARRAMIERGIETTITLENYVRY